MVEIIKRRVGKKTKRYQKLNAEFDHSKGTSGISSGEAHVCADVFLLKLALQYISVESIL